VCKSKFELLTERLKSYHTSSDLTLERERESGELLICHLSIHIISFECPLQKKERKKGKRKKNQKKKKEKVKKGGFVIVRSL